MTTSASPTQVETRPASGGLFAMMLRQLGIDTSYLFLGFPLATTAFIVIVTGVALGISMSILWVGVPILTATLYAARGFAEVERRSLRLVLNRTFHGSHYRRLGPEASFWRRMLDPIRDGQYWLDSLHAVVHFPVALATFVISFTWWCLALGGLTYPLYDWALPHDADNIELPELLGFADTALVRTLVYLIIGLFFTLTLPFVIRGCALVRAKFSQGMLTSIAVLKNEIAELSVGKATAQAQTAAAVSAEATALRKLERDIHDGPQQRLVRLAVDLGRAKQQFETDPDAARATVDEALSQTRETLNELRALSRGIAPPILTDRGLGAAVAALAARSTITVDLDVRGVGRLTALAEQTAYFVVAESLTNVAKHSDATECQVRLTRDGAVLHVLISDNGSGGAHVAKGHGLAGLTDRVRAAGGELHVSSPPGGPTEITAEVPCPSPEPDAN